MCAVAVAAVAIAIAAVVVAVAVLPLSPLPVRLAAVGKLSALGAVEWGFDKMVVAAVGW